MRVGAYEIVEEIGRGGAGRVYRARGADGRDVALKALGREGADAFSRFDRERRMLRELGMGEGFVPLVDAGVDDGLAFIVMPFLAGGTLRDRLAHGPLAIEDAIALGIELARALGRAHARGIVHRDVKPANVLFAAGDSEGEALGGGARSPPSFAEGGWGRPLIADLGLAKHFAREAPGAAASVSVSRPGDIRGTTGYMPPEQLASSKEVGPAADVFAMGAMLFECLAGEPPFGETPLEAIARTVDARASSLAELRPDAPRWLVATIARALSADPRRRFRDGEELARALEARGGSRSHLVPIAAAVVTVIAIAIALVSTRGEPIATTPTASSSAPSPTRTIAATPRPRVDEIKQPEWYTKLSPRERPPLPLPRGLSFGDTPGEYVNAKDKSILLYVPAGKFTMGRDDGVAKEGPAHAVELSAYFIGKLETTNEQFAAFAWETGYKTTAEREGQIHVPTAEGHPVTRVSWLDAKAYCDWAGLALPSEAQWERAAAWDAARGRARRFPWGDEEPSATSKKLANLLDLAWARTREPGEDPERALPFPGYDDGYGFTSPVGAFPDGVSPIGAHDMGGNVCEWCLDGWNESFYQIAPRLDPVCPPERAYGRAQRGGGYKDGIDHLRSTARWGRPAGDSAPDLGFRVARSAK